MKALILNSGVGRRMGAATQDAPKAMTELGCGYTILSRQLEQLQQLGIQEAIITTGAFATKLMDYANGLANRPALTYVHNPDFAATNYIVSLHLAAPLLAEEDLLFLHGDLVLETGVLQDLLQAPHSAMATDASLPLPQKDFKAQLFQGRITSVGVALFGADCVACQPAYKLLRQDMALWLRSIEAFVARGETGVYAENALNALNGALPLFPLELYGRLCHEIDDPDDLALVSQRFRCQLAQNP